MQTSHRCGTKSGPKDVSKASNKGQGTRACEQGLEQGLERGRLEGARSVLLGQGRKKFGKAPTKKQLERLESVADPALFEELGERLLSVKSWADLLAGL